MHNSLTKTIAQDHAEKCQTVKCETVKCHKGASPQRVSTVLTDKQELFLLAAQLRRIRWQLDESLRNEVQKERSHLASQVRKLRQRLKQHVARRLEGNIRRLEERYAQEKELRYIEDWGLYQELLINLAPEFLRLLCIDMYSDEKLRIAVQLFKASFSSIECKDIMRIIIPQNLESCPQSFFELEKSIPIDKSDALLDGEFSIEMQNGKLHFSAQKHYEALLAQTKTFLREQLSPQASKNCIFDQDLLAEQSP